MATERQIAANRRNAALSTGPRTVEGKAASRGNALTHGMAAETLVAPPLAKGYDARLADWERDIKPGTAEGRFALEGVIVCTFRIEECRRNLVALSDRDVARADLAWDLDREADAALVAAKLAKRPELVARQLMTSRQGVERILRGWDRLGEALDAKGGAWSEAEVSSALDLLGTPADLRDGRAPFDPAVPGGDIHTYRREFVLNEAGRLRALLSNGLNTLDAMDRAHAEAGGTALQGKPAALVLRYEREAWRRYDTLLKAAKESAPILEAAEPEPEIETEDIESDAEIDAATEKEVAEAVAGKTPAEIEAMIANVRAEMAHRGIPVPHEQPEPAPKLNRRQRRKMAAVARRA